MQEQKSSFDSLQEIKDIRRIMERSSRFISLSGLSGVAAGATALIGAGVAHHLLKNYKENHSFENFSYDASDWLSIRLTGLAILIFAFALSVAFFFTWRRAKKQGLPVWDHTSRRLAWKILIPLVTGAAFIFGMLRYDAWVFVSPACLIFYGLALVNASKYTLADIRYLGYCEILLGLINMYFIGYGLWFWAIGFGVLHIVYGIIMWNKYERKPRVL